MGHLRIASPPDRPLLLWDGDCGFCKRWVSRWRSRTAGRVDDAPYQIAAARFPQISPEALAGAIHLLTPDGLVFVGAEAAFRALSYAPRGGRLLWAYEKVPGFSRAAEAAYRFVASRRKLFSRLTSLLWGPNPDPPAFRISGVVFLRLLGLVYLIAFVSLWTQIRGLVGSRGILPIGEFLEVLRGTLGMESYWSFPTLCWISSHDWFLGFQCGAGAVLSVLVLAGVAQAPCLALSWVFYLSLVTAGREFLSFQWDGLLLEAGLLAVLAAPPGIRLSPFRAPEPHRGALRLERWLLFRLMLGSGIVKLASGDLTWRNLTALRTHYETQPLPTWIGWYAHQLPAWFQSVSALAMFAIELGMPLLIFAPRRLRLVAFASFVTLQLLIGVTGNYAFFNVLTLVLCLLLLDDLAWPGALRKRFENLSPRRSLWPGRLVAPFAAVSFVFGALLLLGQAVDGFRWPGILRAAYTALAPARSLNPYGLFAVMTTSRPEIVVEGSSDGRTWRAYAFRWKPGDPARRPDFVEPHQPRLDWQMWFAALGRIEGNRWVAGLLARLLEGEPEVLALLAENPFPDSPPRYVRAVTYDYRFTDGESRARDGTWWRRSAVGPYSPVFSLSRGPREGTSPGKTP